MVNNSAYVKKGAFVVLVSLLLVQFDQIIKLLISRRIVLNQSVPLIKDIFHITLIHNSGAGFGILPGYRWFFILFAVLVVGSIVYFYKKIPDNSLFQLAVAFVCAGTIGNLIDRLRFGYVIDYLDFRIWPVFNLADIAISIGVIYIIYFLWKEGDLS